MFSPFILQELKLAPQAYSWDISRSAVVFVVDHLQPATAIDALCGLLLSNQSSALPLVYYARSIVQGEPLTLQLSISRPQDTPNCSPLPFVLHLPTLTTTPLPKVDSAQSGVRKDDGDISIGCLFVQKSSSWRHDTAPQNGHHQQKDQQCCYSVEPSRDPSDVVRLYAQVTDYHHSRHVVTAVFHHNAHCSVTANCSCARDETVSCRHIAAVIAAFTNKSHPVLLFDKLHQWLQEQSALVPMLLANILLHLKRMDMIMEVYSLCAHHVERISSHLSAETLPLVYTPADHSRMATARAEDAADVIDLHLKLGHVSDAIQMLQRVVSGDDAAAGEEPLVAKRRKYDVDYSSKSLMSVMMGDDLMTHVSSSLCSNEDDLARQISWRQGRHLLKLLLRTNCQPESLCHIAYRAFIHLDYPVGAYILTHFHCSQTSDPSDIWLQRLSQLCDCMLVHGQSAMLCNVDGEKCEENPSLLSRCSFAFAHHCWAEQKYSRLISYGPRDGNGWQLVHDLVLEFIQYLHPDKQLLVLSAIVEAHPLPCQPARLHHACLTRNTNTMSKVVAEEYIPTRCSTAVVKFALLALFRSAHTEFLQRGSRFYNDTLSDIVRMVTAVRPDLALFIRQLRRALHALIETRCLTREWMFSLWMSCRQLHVSELFAGLMGLAVKQRNSKCRLPEKHELLKELTLFHGDMQTALR